VVEGNVSRGVDRVTDQKTGAVLSEQSIQRMFALLDRRAP
jgi:hypothetical protein